MIQFVLHAKIQEENKLLDNKMSSESVYPIQN